MTTCKLWIHRLLFLDLHQHKPPCLWLWDPTQRFQQHKLSSLGLQDHLWRFRLSAIVDLVAATSDLPVLMVWEWFPIVTLIEKYIIPFRSYKSTSKVSKSSKNVVRVFLYILEVFHLKPKTFKQSLGWAEIEFCKISCLRFSIGQI